MMWTITFRMLSVLAFFAFVNISTVQSRSNGFNCLEQNHRGVKSCHGQCVRAWTSARGNEGSYFCANSVYDLEQVAQTLMPLLQKLQTTSEKVTLKVGIDLDGTIVRIDGTIDPSTIFNAMARKGISLDFKSNDRYDHVTFISKLYGFLSFNERALRKLSQVRLCSGRPQKCTVFDGSNPSTDIDGAYEAKLIENKKVTATFGDDITLETSVQGDYKNLLEKAKKNEIVDMEGTAIFKVDNSNLKIVIQGNTEKIPLSVWLETHSPSTDSIESELLDLENHLTGIAASVCIGTECFHAGACSTNLCNTKQNLLEITNSPGRV